MDLGQGCARAAGREGGLLGGQHNLVDRAAGAAVLAADGIGAGDVRRVAAELGAGVDEDQLSLGQGLVVGDVVENRGVGATPHDGAVGGAAGAPAAKGVAEGGLELVLVAAGLGELRGVRGGGPRGRSAAASRMIATSSSS